MNPPKIFISYAHSSQEHKQSVANLAAVLRENGLTVVVDVDVKKPQGPEEGWARWMKHQIKDADWVLMFFDEVYRRRFDGEEDPGKGLGATWEGAIFTRHYYRDGTLNRKFIPLLGDKASSALIPDELFDYSCYHIPKQARELALKLRTEAGGDAPVAGTEAVGNVKAFLNAKSRRWLAVMLFVAAAILVALVSWHRWANSKAPELPANFKTIESHLFVAIDSKPTPRHTNLFEYFSEANPQIIQHLRRQGDLYRLGSNGVSATFIMGPAGSGKSFIARFLRNGAVFDSTNTFLIRLHSFLTTNQTVRMVLKPDLVCGTNMFNRLPGVEQPSSLSWQALLNAAGAHGVNRYACIVIDDLDEIDPEAAKQVIANVEREITNGRSSRFCHVVLFGRPEAFWEFLRDPRRTPVEGVEQMRMRNPIFSNVGDLRLVVLDYFSFNKLPRPPQRILDDFVKLVIEHPFLTYSIGKLSLANDLAGFVQAQSPANELTNVLFDGLLQRNNQTHQRPKERSGIYLQLLEEIAVKYVDKLDTNGYFYVNHTDEITSADDITSRVAVRNVLNRSGLVDLVPVNANSARYRFDPFWVHGFLVARENWRRLGKVK